MLALITSLPSILSKSVYFRHLTIIFSFSFFFLSYNIILFPPSSIFASLWWISLLWLFFFHLVLIFSLFFSPDPHIVLFPCLIPLYPIPFLFYLCGKLYFLLFFTLFLFLTLIISPPPTLSKSFFFPLVTLYSFLL